MTTKDSPFALEHLELALHGDVDFLRSILISISPRWRMTHIGVIALLNNYCSYVGLSNWFYSASFFFVAFLQTPIHNGADSLKTRQVAIPLALSMLCSVIVFALH